jgi:hypothetical protein
MRPHRILAALAALAMLLPAAAGTAAPSRDARQDARPEGSRTGERRAAQQDVESTHGGDGVEILRSVRAPKGWQVGAPIEMRLAVRAPADARVTFPAVADPWGAFEVRSQVTQPAAGARPATFEAVLVAWDAGPAELPALAVQVVGADGAMRSVDVPAVTVEIATSLEADVPLTELPADIRGPVEIDDGRWMRWALAAAVAAAALAGVWWLRSRGGRGAPEPELAPHERARRDLAQLELDRLPERGEVEPFYVRLSDIVRAYVEGRFGIAAPDRTTQEFLREASRDPQLAGEHERELAAFLRAADMVKFAEARPDPESCGRSLESMRSFVDRTAPAPAAEGTAP